MNERKLSRYSLEQAANEAGYIKAKLKFGEAGSYQEAERRVGDDRRKDLEEELIKPATEEELPARFFLSVNIIYFAEECRVPKDLIEEIHLARITYALQKLKETYASYIKSPREREQDKLVQFVGHSLGDVYFTSQKSLGYKDVAEDFHKCRLLMQEAVNSGRASEGWTAAVGDMLNKYSTDERFAKDPFELKRDIAKKLSDLAKS